MYVTCPDCGGALRPHERVYQCTNCVGAWAISITPAYVRSTTTWENGEFAGLIRAVMDADNFNTRRIPA